MWVTSYNQRNENGDNQLLEKWFEMFIQDPQKSSYSTKAEFNNFYIYYSFKINPSLNKLKHAYLRRR